jgi:CDP-diglyceride synthetase
VGDVIFTACNFESGDDGGGITVFGVCAYVATLVQIAETNIPKVSNSVSFRNFFCIILFLSTNVLNNKLNKNWLVASKLLLYFTVGDICASPFGASYLKNCFYTVRCF